MERINNQNAIDRIANESHIVIEEEEQQKSTTKKKRFQIFKYCVSFNSFSNGKISNRKKKIKQIIIFVAVGIYFDRIIPFCLHQVLVCDPNWFLISNNSFK